MAKFRVGDTVIYRGHKRKILKIYTNVFGDTLYMANNKPLSGMLEDEITLYHPFNMKTKIKPHRFKSSGLGLKWLLRYIKSHNPYL